MNKIKYILIALALGLCMEGYAQNTKKIGRKPEGGSKVKSVDFMKMNTGYGKGCKSITLAGFYSSEKQHYKVYARYYQWYKAFIDAGVAFDKITLSGGKSTWTAIMLRGGYSLYDLNDKFYINAIGGVNFTFQSISGFEPSKEVKANLIQAVIGGEILWQFSDGLGLVADTYWWKSINESGNDDVIFTIGLRKKF